MDLCVEHGVEPGSPVTGLSQEGQERGKKKRSEERNTSLYILPVVL